MSSERGSSLSVGHSRSAELQRFAKVVADRLGRLVPCWGFFQLTVRGGERSARRFIKRLLDMMLSFTALVVLSHDGRDSNVYEAYLRWLHCFSGANRPGKAFRMIKFRSMVAGAEQMGAIWNGER